jgi:Pyruvate/2-oxoacid:ferredoxin oxidoreductase delta subunit
MAYKKVKIYFASGTGNSYRVAVWFQEECVKRNIEAEVIPINLANPKYEIDPSPDCLVVLAYPTHGLLPPWSMIKFIFKMPVKKGTRSFCTPTRGAFYLGPLLVPGIAGIASMLPTIVLPFKGYKPVGSVSFDMPANMTMIHNRFSDRHLAKILNGAKRKADRYFGDILDGESVWLTLNNLWEYVWGILFLYYHTLFPIVYLLIGRFFMGKTNFASDRCIGCGVCAKTCPNNAIAMVGERNPRPMWMYNCEECMRCFNYCKQRAVNFSFAWAYFLVWISYFPGSMFILKTIESYFPQGTSIHHWYLTQIVDALYIYPLYIFVYYLFFLVLKIKPVNRFFTYTGVSVFFRRYNEPSTELADLTSKKEN